MCREIEILSKRDEVIMYDRIARMSGKERPRKSFTIRGVNEKQQINLKRKVYVEDLYKNEQREEYRKSQI